MIHVTPVATYTMESLLLLGLSMGKNYATLLLILIVYIYILATTSQTFNRERRRLLPVSCSIRCFRKRLQQYG